MVILMMLYSKLRGGSSACVVCAGFPSCICVSDSDSDSGNGLPVPAALDDVRPSTYNEVLPRLILNTVGEDLQEIRDSVSVVLLPLPSVDPSNCSIVIPLTETALVRSNDVNIMTFEPASIHAYQDRLPFLLRRSTTRWIRGILSLLSMVIILAGFLILFVIQGHKYISSLH